MPTKIMDASGKEHEFKTQEEIDALIEEEKKKALEGVNKEFDTAKKELEKKNKEFATLTVELETAKEALDGANEGTKDWAEARKLIKTLEGKVETLSKEKDLAKEEFAKELRGVRTSIFDSQKNSWIDNLSGGDDEVKKKIEFHYNRLGIEVKDEKEAQEIMKDAYLLATGKQAPNMFNVARGFGGEAPKTREPQSQEVSELGKKFGVSDEDIAKFSAKANEKKPNQ